ncbi:BON domain-containing protein [Allopusillimonas ginsengisoli]|uniref:BON domain-containing protein n=1 Tax=Allopusillimonas ginsengisoli TaxID=453575 RepID=UPI0039C3B1F8
MPARSTAHRLLLASLAFATLATVSGCGLLVVGGTAVTTAVVATDRRTTGEQVEDQSIELKVAAEMRRLFEDRARVAATSYAGLVLLTGDVPSEADKQKAQSAAAAVEKVKKVINELRVGELTSISVRSNDTWITSKVLTTLINTKEVPSRTITVQTERGVVYLLGKVTQDEGKRAAIAASRVSGVNKVVKLFEYVTAESLAQPLAPATSTQAPAANSSASPDAAPEGVQTMPVQ